MWPVLQIVSGWDISEIRKTAPEVSSHRDQTKISFFRSLGVFLILLPTPGSVIIDNQFSLLKILPKKLFSPG